MYLAIITLPLLAFLIAGLLGRKIGKKGVQLITSGSVSTAAILAIVAFYETALKASVFGYDSTSTAMIIMPWIESEILTVNWGFQFDSISITMCVVILSISSLVHIYSIGYMSEDPHIQRFFAYLSLFTFFMLILVCSDNYLLMFVGWEGVGVASYLLINFWFTRIQANKSAMQAILMNRIGDWGLSIALFSLIWLFGATDYSTIFSIRAPYDSFIVTFITIFLLIAAVGKSAQLGLHTWLPSAMEGPTPVSALIHAATMVTAGVYLILRSSPLFELAPTSLICVCIIGSLTSIFAATTGLFQNDLKRVIAYSTCSQLGYMVFAAGLSQYEVAFFHLFNHAYFKALLFLSAGSIIHALHDEQDMRKMGGLVNILPFTYTMILIGSLSLMALPFLTGYYSKDVILEVAYGQFLVTGTFTYWLGTITAVITAYYSSKSLILGFFGTPNGSKKVMMNAHEAPLIMAIPMFLLSICSIFIGYIAKDFFIGVGSSGIISSGVGAYEVISTTALPFDIEFISTQFGIQFVPLFASLLGMILAFNLESRFALSATKDVTYTSSTLFDPNFNIIVGITRFFNRRLWFDTIYNGAFASGTLHYGGIFAREIDKGFLPLFGPLGLQHILLTVSRFFSTQFDTGFIAHYAQLILFAATVILLIFGVNF